MLQRWASQALRSAPRNRRVVGPLHWARSLHASSPLTFRPASTSKANSGSDSEQKRAEDYIRSFRSTTCGDCHVELTPQQMAAMPLVRKGRGLYQSRTLCDGCWDTLYERAGQKQIETFARNKERKARSDAMMEVVLGIDAYEAVPVRYATEKLATSRIGRPGYCLQWHRKYLWHSVLRSHLQIEKVRNRYRCNKLRVDALDFDVYYPYRPELRISFDSI